MNSCTRSSPLTQNGAKLISVEDQLRDYVKPVLLEAIGFNMSFCKTFSVTDSFCSMPAPWSKTRSSLATIDDSIGLHCDDVSMC